jgi:hypothetical protein
LQDLLPVEEPPSKKAASLQAKQFAQNVKNGVLIENGGTVSESSEDDNAVRLGDAMEVAFNVKEQERMKDHELSKTQTLQHRKNLAGVGEFATPVDSNLTSFREGLIYMEPSPLHAVASDKINLLKMLDAPGFKFGKSLSPDATPSSSPEPTPEKLKPIELMSSTPPVATVAVVKKVAIEPGIVVNSKKKKTMGKDFSLLMKGEEGYHFLTLYTRWKKSDKLIHTYWKNLTEDMIADAGINPDWFKQLTAFFRRAESITASSQAYEGRMSFDMVKTIYGQITREGVIGELQKVETLNTDPAGKSVATGFEHRETSTFEKFIENVKEFHNTYLSASGEQQDLTVAAASKAARNSQFNSKAKSTMKGKAGGGEGAASGGNGNCNAIVLGSKMAPVMRYKTKELRIWGGGGEKAIRIRSWLNSVCAVCCCENIKRTWQQLKVQQTMHQQQHQQPNQAVSTNDVR